MRLWKTIEETCIEPFFHVKVFDSCSAYNAFPYQQYVQGGSCETIPIRLYHVLCGWLVTYNVFFVVWKQIMFVH